MMDMGSGSMTTSSANSMSTGGQDHSGMSMNSMSSTTEGTNMGSIFFTSTSTPLFTEALRPTSAAGYAGLCIFLIVLAILTRCLMAVRTLLEQKQLDRERKRRYVVVRDQPTEAQNVLQDHDSKDGMLITARGPEEKVRVLTAATRPVTAWRLSTDLPRALLTTVVAGMGYLLMLAVMTFNVGYFLSVLGGIFLGDLAVGRFTAGGGEH